VNRWVLCFVFSKRYHLTKSHNLGLLLLQNIVHHQGLEIFF
jgi:hypothetical protein